MMRIFYIFSLILFSPVAWCTSVEKKIDLVVIQKPQSIEIGDNWSDKTMNSIYKGTPGNLDKTIKFLVDDTPFSAMYNWVSTSAEYPQAEKLAATCKKINEGKMWDQIACISQSIEETFKHHKWPDNATFCRAHAQAFKETFEKLHIPRSQVFYWDASTSIGKHVINRITLTDKYGRIFSYVMDVGWRPNQIFPMAEITKNFHAKYGKNLPEISQEEPKLTYAPDPCYVSNKNEDLEENLKLLWNVVQQSLFID